jgi:hypothetical protein
MHDVSTIERAFQLAKSGHIATIQDLKSQLTREGFSITTITGESLSTQLRNMINAARTVSKRRRLPRS